MTFCDRCSRRLPPGAGACACGAPTVVATDVRPPAVAPLAASVASGEERRIALRRIGASAVVLVLGLAVILLDRDETAGTATSTAAQTEWFAGADSTSASEALPDPGPNTGSSSEQDGRSSGNSSADDLGLATPISSPPCTGGFAVFVGAAVDPSNYRQDVQRYLAAHPGAEYLLAATSCSSLARTSNGNDIYAVYHGPFDTLREACAQKRRSGGDSYVRRLDDLSPAGQVVSC